MRLSNIILAGAVGVGVWFVVNDAANASNDVIDGDYSLVNTDQPVTLAWGSRVSPDFRATVVQVANTLQIDPSWLMAVIARETAFTFSSSIQNPNSSATGLIQFMSGTAEGLGTTVSDLSAMDPVSQLSYVQQYLEPFAGRMNSVGDVYLAVFYPKLIGSPANTVIASKGSAVYNGNSNFDTSKVGVITVAMVDAAAEASLALGMVPPNVYIGDVQTA